MVENLKPRQGAFFPGEDGSITIGEVEVLTNGVPNVGKVKRWRELVDLGNLELSRLGQVNEKIGNAKTKRELEEANIEGDEAISSFKQIFNLLDQSKYLARDF